MRAVFFGTATFAVPALKALSAHHDVVLCITQPDRPKGRGLFLEASPVKEAALALKIPVAQPAPLRAPDLASISADIGVVAAYGQLIRKEVIELFPQGILGIHPSLLPKYRGAAPVAWAILSGETTTGLTIFRINEALDAGAVLTRKEVAIEPGETAQALTQRLSSLGAEELLRAMQLISASQAVFVPQEDKQATLAPKLTKEQGRIDWKQPAPVIERQIRALAPWPGTWTEWRGKMLKISHAVAASDQGSGKVPGTFLRTSGDVLVISAGQGCLLIKELQLSGKKKMTAQEFISGYRVQTGDSLE